MDKNDAREAAVTLAFRVMCLKDDDARAEVIAQALVELMDVTEQTDLEEAVIAAYDEFKRVRRLG